MIDESLKLAMDFVNIKSLPKEHKGAYRTRSVCLANKSGGVQVYCVGIYDDKEERTVILKDFSKGCGHITDIISVHPINEKEIKSTFDFTAMKVHEMKEWLDKNNVIYFGDKKKDYIKAYWRYISNNKNKP